MEQNCDSNVASASSLFKKGCTRFAPSPTGYLHLGHVLSALYVQYFAQQLNLELILRIEDHDQMRYRAEYEKGILAELDWLGYSSNSVLNQRERFGRYEAIFKLLQEQNLVYACTCTRSQLMPYKKVGQMEWVYPGLCSHRNSFEIPSQKHSWRLRVTQEEISWSDYFEGDFIHKPAKQCGDWIIQDKDSCWTYLFCNGIDDLDQNISHVIRGQDLIESTARQIQFRRLLQKLLHSKNQSELNYAHHPLILDEQGIKLSKRFFSESISQLKEKGHSPQEVWEMAKKYFKV